MPPSRHAPRRCWRCSATPTWWACRPLTRVCQSKPPHAVCCPQVRSPGSSPWTSSRRTSSQTRAKVGTFRPVFPPSSPQPQSHPSSHLRRQGGSESLGGRGGGFRGTTNHEPGLEHRPRARVAPACVDRGNRHIPRPEPRVRLLVPGRILPANRRPLLPVCYATHSRLGGRATGPAGHSFPLLPHSENLVSLRGTILEGNIRVAQG